MNNTSEKGASTGGYWVFNPPPGWLVPLGWQPPPGWQPDPSWPPPPPGWNFWLPAGSYGSHGSHAGTAQPPRSAGGLTGGLTSDEMATALRILFPVQSWLHDKGWRQGVRLAVIVYGLLPLLFLALFSSSSDLSTPGWAYSLYVAPLWLLGFYLLIRPGPVGKQEVQIAAGIVVWTLIWMNLITININDALHANSISLPDGLVIGVNEEITKALPVLLAGLWLSKYRNVKLTPRMGMFLGTIAGLTFGIFEEAFYTSNALLVINQAGSANTAVAGALAFAERVFVDGFEHAVWAGISGFFIGLALTYPRRRNQLILLGVAVAAVLHALNDFFSSDVSIWMAIIVQAVSLLLFLSYTMSAAAIEEKVRETPLFRGDSMVMEAHHPGQAPPAG